VIFTSDHGEYAGSHGLRNKGGALYEEAINVPLIISFPSARSASKTGAYPFVIPYACSSVDLLPFLYTLGLGNELWRNNTDDMIYYLYGRESIWDGIFTANNNLSYYPYPGVQHRRLSGIGLNNNTTGSNNWQLYQPFVLHTTDEIPVFNDANGNAGPGHAVAFRTVDQTYQNPNSTPIYGQSGRNSYGGYGGGKLGAYTIWNTSNNNLNNAPIIGDYTSSSVPPDYEFYTYSSGNAAEAGNQFWDSNNNTVSAAASPYVDDFFNTGNNTNVVIQDELYLLNTSGSSSNTIQQVQNAIQTAFNNYISYLDCTGQITDGNGNTHNSNTCASNMYSDHP